MKNYVAILIIFAITNLWIVDGTHAVSADELWYPGGIGSSWTYQTNAGYVITATVGDAVMLNGIRYKTVKESSELVGAWGDENIIDPFLTFRADGQNKIVGYGTDMYEKIRDNVVDALIESGIDRNQIRVSFLNKEWVLLDANKPNGTWTVMRIKTTVDMADWGLEDMIEIRELLCRMGALTPITITMKDGQKEFQAYELYYTYSWSIEGPFGDDQDINEIYSLFVVPEIGVIRIARKATDPQKAIDLLEYMILPSGQPVQQRGKLSIAWGAIKTG